MMKDFLNLLGKYIFYVSVTGFLLYEKSYTALAVWFSVVLFFEKITADLDVLKTTYQRDRKAVEGAIARLKYEIFNNFNEEDS